LADGAATLVARFVDDMASSPRRLFEPRRD
jgi:hypothetical protein